MLCLPTFERKTISEVELPYTYVIEYKTQYVVHYCVTQDAQMVSGFLLIYFSLMATEY
jgi:sulfur transfer protein SufE